MPWFEIIVGYVMQWLVTVDTTIHGRLHCSLQAIPLQKKSIPMSLKKSAAEMQLRMHTKLKESTNLVTYLGSSPSSVT